MLSDVERELAQLTAGPSHVLPGLVASTSTTSSSGPHYFCSGLASEQPGETRRVSQESIFWVASCTKLLTSIATLQCVDRGLITLDTPVGSVLPQFDGSQVLTGFDEGKKPILRPAAAAVLVRHLLTHTCGLAYEQPNPSILEWFASQGIDGEKLRGKDEKLYGVPLLADPGEEWSYGQGLDWAGILVRHLTKTRQVGEYFERHIFAPLGIKVAGYRQERMGLSSEELEDRLVQRTVRDSDGRLAPSQNPSFLDAHIPDSGGAGLFITPREFLKILDSILRNDGKLLDPQNSRNWCFSAQLEPLSTTHRSLLAQLAESPWGALMRAGLPTSNPLSPENDGIEFNHSLIGLLSRKKGETNWVASWAGLSNLFWTIDRDQGLATFWCMQLMPPGDDLCLKWYRKWFEATYHRQENGTTPVQESASSTTWGREQNLDLQSEIACVDTS